VLAKGVTTDPHAIVSKEEFKNGLEINIDIKRKYRIVMFYFNRIALSYAMLFRMRKQMFQEYNVFAGPLILTMILLAPLLAIVGKSNS
jgi:hypothetical protein